MSELPEGDALAVPAWPDDLESRLRGLFPIWTLGSESPWFQLGFCDACLNLAGQDPFAARLAASLGWWMFQLRPLDAKPAARAPALVRLGAGLGSGLPARHQAIAAMAARPAPPDQAELYEHLDALGDEGMLLDFLRAVLPVPGLGPLWLGRALHLILRLPDPDAALGLIAACDLGPGGAVLRDRILAEFSFHRLDEDLAAKAAARLRGDLFAPYGRLLEAMLAMRRGEAGLAASLLHPLWRAMPWNVNLACLLAGLVSPTAPATAELAAGDTAVLAYTWNKAELIGRTLESLAASRLGACPVIVLDNGSADDTQAVLARAGSMFAPGQLAVVTLPVNVGAPAARNWLLALPEVAGRNYAAFIDDDVILPENWLESLRGAALAHPRAGAVGCRIVDASPPGALQSADFNILPPDMGEAALEEIAERIFMCNNCGGLADVGLFAYQRACLSVSGCCHLVSMEAVRAAGRFDVAFAPTQFDDLERDLRSWLAGYPALFHGGLAVRHVQNSSLRQATSSAQVAHITGNKIKLESKFSDDQAARLVAENHQALWAGFAAASRTAASIAQDIPRA